MDHPKYSQKPSIPAVELAELSLRPLEVERPTAPPPIDVDGAGGDVTKVDGDDLRVMQHEGGNGAAYVPKPVPAVGGPEGK